jgi:hypothetical protein
MLLHRVPALEVAGRSRSHPEALAMRMKEHYTRKNTANLSRLSCVAVQIPPRLTEEERVLPSTRNSLSSLPPIHKAEKWQCDDEQQGESSNQTFSSTCLSSRSALRLRSNICWLVLACPQGVCERNSHQHALIRTCTRSASSCARRSPSASNAMGTPLQKHVSNETLGQPARAWAGRKETAAGCHFP